LFSTTKLLGALSLDMVAVFGEQWHFTYFAQDILKVGPEGFGFESCSCGWVVSNVNCFRLCAYEQKCRFEAFRIYFCFRTLHHYFWTFYYFLLPISICF
jgi:hypothetical protein